MEMNETSMHAKPVSSDVKTPIEKNSGSNCMGRTGEQTDGYYIGHNCTKNVFH